MNKKYGVLSSSQNPEEIANKVKGTVLALSSVIIFIASRYFGIQITATDMVQFATVISTLAGLVWAVYGGILHLIAWFYDVKAKNS